MLAWSKISVWMALACILSACASPTPNALPTAAAIPSITRTPRPMWESIPTGAPAATVTPELHPMRLEQVGQFGGAANILALNGDMVYLQVGPRLVIVDVANPAEPTIVGRSNVLPAGIKAIAAQDEYALVEDDQGTVWQFETPASGDPQPIRSFAADDPERPPLQEQARDFVQVGDYRVELAEEWWQGNELFLYVYKDDALVTTPIPPLPAGETAATPYLAVRGRYAYAAIRNGLTDRNTNY